MSLADFLAAGVVDDSDVQVASALMRLGGDDNPDVALAVTLCVQALRTGSVCVDLAAGQPLPTPPDWVGTVAGSPLVEGPLRLRGSLLYLRRYWEDEQLVRRALLERAGLFDSDLDGLDEMFPRPEPDLQRLAVATALLRQCAIIAGGPGTGKTTTVARLLALLHRQGKSVALAAPTGKAAARLTEAVAEAMTEADREAVGDVTASTLHRLLGARKGSGRFSHDRSNPLPQDAVIVDETSMVSLPLMARLLEALRLDAQLILVGDPNQLASIDAGAVLGDIVAAAGTANPDLAARLAQACPHETFAVERAAAGVVALERNYRFDGGIARLAAAIRDGNADSVMEELHAGHPDVEFVDGVESVRADVVTQAGEMARAATSGDVGAALGALNLHRVLCAHREGLFGVAHWDELISGWTSRYAVGPWYPGQPLIVTANDRGAGIYNGDTGVIVSIEGELRAAFGPRAVLPLSHLDAARTLGAMTIHRSQGSQFDAVTVVIPPADSALLTRELLYTAVTRARSRIRLLGTEDAVRAGVARQVRRASGLREAQA